MFHNKIVITIFALILLISGLFLFYISNINKTLFVDVYAENPLIIQEDKLSKDIHVTKYNDTAYTFLLPAAFLYQEKTIYLKNTSNENIQLAFHSEQKKNGDKEIEFSLNVKDIQVNGQNFHKNKKTVWYERPYIDTISVNKDETVALSVTYKTKLMLRNINIQQFAAGIVLLLCSIVLLVKCYLWNFININSIKFIHTILVFLEKYGEWDSVFIQKYRDIDVVYRKTFWSVFIILNLVFLYYNIHFIWGNHDWNYVMQGMWGNVAWGNGRFTNYLPNQLLGGRFLPLLNVSFALFGYSFIGILLAYYWKVPKTFFNYLILSLVVVLNPLVLYWFSFFIDVVSHLWLPSIMILALILSEKKSLYSFILAYLLFIFGLGIYPSGIATVTAVLFGKFIIVYCFESHTIKFLYQQFKRTFCCVLLSLISFKILISILIALNLANANIPQLQMNLLGGNLVNFFELIKSSYLHLFYAVPFYDYNIIRLIYGISLFSFIVLCCYQKKYNGIKFSQFCFLIVTIFLFPIVLNIPEFILGQKIFLARIYFFGNIFLGAFFISLLLKTKFVWAKNILIVFLIFLLPMSTYRLYEAQKLWKIEFEYENDMFKQKILQPLHDTYDYSQKPAYSILIFGTHTPLILSRYSNANYCLNEDGTFLTYKGSLYFWNFPRFIEFYLPEFRVKNYDVIEKTSNGCNSKMGQAGYIDFIHELLPYYDILKNEMTQWPHSNSVFLKDNYLIINFDNEVLQEVLKILEEKRKVK